MAITVFARTGTPQHRWLGSMAELAPEGDCHDQDSHRTVRRARPASMRPADRGARQRQQAHRGGTQRLHGRRDQPVPRVDPEQGACASCLASECPNSARAVGRSSKRRPSAGNNPAGTTGLGYPELRRTALPLLKRPGSRLGSSDPPFSTRSRAFLWLAAISRGQRGGAAGGQAVPAITFRRLNQITARLLNDGTNTEDMSMNEDRVVGTAEECRRASWKKALDA